MPKRDSRIFDLIKAENKRQLEGLELIASENFVSPQVLEAMGSVLTNKYAEGYPGKRYYGGCEVVDEVETLAIERAKKMFGAEYANVQPHSGSQANTEVYAACLQPGDKILGFDLSAGGHLTHGSPVNFSGKLYNPAFYSVKKEDGLIDYEALEETAAKEKPKLIIAGASSYSRDFDYKRFREIADENKAILVADIAHPAGFIATGLLNDAVKHCHIVTTTTHKTLRGPRGGMIVMGKDFENQYGQKWRSGKLKKMSTLLNSSVFPGNQGGPLEHVIAAKAVAFGEALTPAYKTYIENVGKNAKALARLFVDHGYHVISGGTDNHMMLIDLRNKNLTGKEIENALVRANITVNKNMVPFDTQSPFVTSGIRIGTPAVTTRGLQEKDMETVFKLIHEVIENRNDEGVYDRVKAKVKELMADRPLYMD